MAMRILVTGASTFFATRLIHDLGRRGAEVTAADGQWFSAGRASRYVTRGLCVPRLGADPGGFLRAITHELKSRRYDLLLPTFEESLLFAEYQDELREHTALFLPPFDVMQRLHHKPSLDLFCLEHGIPSPHTFVIPNREYLRGLSDELPFPVVLKLTAANNSVGRAYCRDWATLEDCYCRLEAQQRRVGAELPFVQQKIEGDLVFTLSFCWEGQKLAEVLYRTQRTYPQDGGTAAHRESIDHPAVAQITGQIVSATSWTGFLGLDFIVERESGIPYLIDANTRANPAIHLGYLSGIDWSQILFDLLDGRVPAPQTARTGIHAHTLLVDAAWLMEGLFPSVAPLWRFPQRLHRFLFPGWPVDSRDELISLREFGPVAVLALQSILSFYTSLTTRRQISQVMLDDANYNPVTVAMYRQQRLELAAADQRAGVGTAPLRPIPTGPLPRAG